MSLLHLSWIYRDSKLKQQQQQHSGSGSEDRESGIGQSLPSSPIAGERPKETT